MHTTTNVPNQRRLSAPPVILDQVPSSAPPIAPDQQCIPPPMFQTNGACQHHGVMVQPQHLHCDPAAAACPCQGGVTSVPEAHRPHVCCAGSASFPSCQGCECARPGSGRLQSLRHRPKTDQHRHRHRHRHRQTSIGIGPRQTSTWQAWSKPEQALQTRLATMRPHQYPAQPAI